VRRSSIQLSVVIPFYNEEETVRPLFKALNRLKPTLPKRTEILLIDDGSHDGTLDLLKEEKLLFPRKVLQLSRNFGHQAALLAGLEQARGQTIVTMDGDLQHPPSLIPKMLKWHRLGIDIVFTMRQDDQSVPFIKQTLSAWFYWVMDRLSATRIRHNASDFRSITRAALTALLEMPERRKFLRGMMGWIGFTSVIVPFKVGARAGGVSKYTLAKMLRLAFDGLTSFSTLPLYLSAIVGFLLSLLSVMYGIYVLFVRFVLDIVVPGWSSVILVSLVIGSVLSLLLALLGIYVAAIYEEVKGRPVYIIKSKYH
jgi:glycosyltransferase involved in cell wall biosynthesis